MPFILRIDSRSKEYTFDDVDYGPYAGLTGMDLEHRMRAKEIPTDCPPDAPENKLILTEETVKDCPYFKQRMEERGLIAIVLEGEPVSIAPFFTFTVADNRVKYAPLEGKDAAGAQDCLTSLVATHGNAVCAMVLDGPAKGATRFTNASGQLADTISGLSEILCAKKVQSLVLEPNVSKP